MMTIESSNAPPKGRAPPKDTDHSHRPRKGDEAGLRAFLEKNAAHLQRFAKVRLGNDEAAMREVVDATLSEAIRNLDALHSDAHAGVPALIWLFRICRLEIKEYVHRVERQTHRKFTAQNLATLNHAIARLGKKQANAAQLCGDETLRHLVVFIFDRLSEMEAAALELKCLGNVSTSTVARLLDQKTPATQELLTLAKWSFHAELERMSNAVQP